MKIGWSVLILCLLCGCRDKSGFSVPEKELLRSQEGRIMRLFVANEPADSLLLRQKSRKLTEEDIRSDYFRILKEGMLQTVNDSSNAGVGIAAPQVGISACLIAVQRFDKEGEPFEFYVNPEILYYSPERVSGPEGCLSVPSVRDSVERSARIVIRYTDELTNDLKEETVEGFTAVIFQHETDHLNGILFTDRKDSGR